MPQHATSAVRQRILDAGIKVFARYGYDATTTRDIAVAAECGEPSVYRLFHSKAKLFASVLEHAFANYPPVPVDPSLPAEQAIQRTLASITRAWAKDAVRLRLFYRVALSQQKAARKVLQKIVDHHYGPILRAIHARQDKGEFRNDLPATVIAQMVMGLLNYEFFCCDILGLEQVAGESLHRKTYHEAIASVLLDGISAK